VENWSRSWNCFLNGKLNASNSLAFPQTSYWDLILITKNTIFDIDLRRIVSAFSERFVTMVKRSTEIRLGEILSARLFCEIFHSVIEVFFILQIMFRHQTILYTVIVVYIFANNRRTSDRINYQRFFRDQKALSLHL
jgi:hypothetical protein